MRRKHKLGFSLVEIMVAVAILMILTFIAIPNLLRSNINANETSTIANLRNLYSAFIMYYGANNKTYPAQLADMAGYINPALVNGEKSGYTFDYVRDSADEFYVNANPKIPRRTGVRYFYMDERSTIRYNTSGEAGENDPPAK